MKGYDLCKYDFQLIIITQFSISTSNNFLSITITQYKHQNKNKIFILRTKNIF